MTVYVDNASIPADVTNGGIVHSSRWCHLTADSSEELMAFARRIGLRPAWVQAPGTALEHFDVTDGKRWAAVRAGAVEITWREAAAQVEAKVDGRPFDLAAVRAARSL